MPIPSDDVGKEGVIDALVANVESMIRADRKVTALKQLQVGFIGSQYNSLWAKSSTLKNQFIDLALFLSRVIYGEPASKIMSSKV